MNRTAARRSKDKALHLDDEADDTLMNYSPKVA